MRGERVSPSNTGRDRAIETLIDMEPHGAFYRASRILDEAVPRALSNRPNLITREALVEQASSLSENEIDSCEKLDALDPLPAIKETPFVNGCERDRILQHHAKLVKVAHNTEPPPGNSAPTPKLVAALRGVFQNSDHDGAHLRQFLENVMHHSAFSTSNVQNKEEDDELMEDEESAEDNEGIHDEIGEQRVASLESIVGNVCRAAATSDDTLEGILIAALSILIQSTKIEEDEHDTETARDEMQLEKVGKSERTTSAPIMPALQVGGVLSLLQIDKDDNSSNDFALDSQLLSYLGQAASVYEERIELQKTRLFARLQAKRERDEAKKALEKEDKVEKVDICEDKDDASPPYPSPLLTPTGHMLEDDDVNNDEDMGDADSDDAVVAMRLAAATTDELSNPRMSEAIFERIISQVSGDNDTTSSEEEGASPPNLDVRDSSDSDDSANSNDDDSTSTARFDDGARNGREEDLDNSHAPLLGSECYNEEAVEIHEDDDADSSSSSSSSDDDNDDGDADADAMLVHENIRDSDEEDEVMLRQALAMSLAEQSASVDLESGGEVSSNQGDRANDRQAKDAFEEKSCASLGTAVPASDVSSSVIDEIGDVFEDEDNSLPPLPVAPSHYPYHSWINDTEGGNDDYVVAADIVDSDVARGDSESSPTLPYFDPAALSKFGSLPSTHVVMHLLSYAALKVQHQTESNNGPTKDNSSSEGCQLSSVPGGIGCSLFLPRQQQECKQPASSIKGGLTMQLLMAAFVLFSKSRSIAIDRLHLAILSEQKNSQGDKTEENIHMNEAKIPSQEEDDPALALAMIYPSSASSPSHSQSAESLEAKGMKRKAAAAAHDTAILLKSLRKRTDAWRQRVRHYSHCTFTILRCLRTYLQTVSRQWLRQRSLPNVADSNSVMDSFKDCLPITVISMLSTALDKFISVSEFRSFGMIVVHDDADEKEELMLLPLKLYREAMLTWGECIPLLYPEREARSEILHSLVQNCYLDYQADKEPPEPLKNLRALPSSDAHSKFHRLHVLCNRLCISDMLSGFVSKPIAYNPEETLETHEISKFRLDDEANERQKLREPIKASSTVRLLGSAVATLKENEGAELRRLYLAICHKCNERTLLWDGFYACSNDDPYIRSVSSMASPALSATDLLRVAPTPSNNLQFDSTKCSDSIAILSDSSAAANGSSVHQRASKVWGTVLSSSYFSPKTGIHRWAVRLDKCERGHVFVGVSTSQASMRTYVGGDKFGWGVIGTQALWHDRRKIRGDYGATFRTGSTILVTLDTDAGTLRFSSWKGSSSSNTAFSLDASTPISSPSRRSSSVGGGTLEDWGIAFEGLPLDSRLYPAVGLYQRDDRVTLLHVESGGHASSKSGSTGGVPTGGLCYYPPHPNHAIDDRFVANTRNYNSMLSFDGVEYAKDILHRVIASIQSGNEADLSLLSSVLPSIAASLSLAPSSIPILSIRCALELLTPIKQCIHVLDEKVATCKHDQHVFDKMLCCGNWIIRATGSPVVLGSSECEEYIVSISFATEKEKEVVGFEGTGVGTTGKSKNGLVAIVGTVCGSAINFVEEWTDGSVEGPLSSTVEDNSSSCIISARLSLDGTKFEGTYRNVQYGTTGHISGMLKDRDAKKADGKNIPPTTVLSDLYVKCEGLLCLAHSHLASVIGADIGNDHSYGADTSTPTVYTAAEWSDKCIRLKACLQHQFLSLGMRDGDNAAAKEVVQSLKRLYSSPSVNEDTIVENKVLHNHEIDSIFSSLSLSVGEIPPLPDYIELVDTVDDRISLQSSGKGSLAVLCPSEYMATRHRVICALIRHSDVHSRLVMYCEQTVESDVHDDILLLWRTGLGIMEAGVRKTLLASNTGYRSKRELAIEQCKLIDQTSSFLLNLSISHQSMLPISDVSEEFLTFYATVDNKADLQFIEDEMDRATKKASLRTVALQQMISLLSNENEELLKTPIAIECCALTLPRLLGRGLVEPLRRSKEIDDLGQLCKYGIGGHYLTQLSGSGQVIQKKLKQAVHALFRTLGKLLEHALQRRKESTSTASLVTTDSLVLSILASFTATLRAEDFDEVIGKSGILRLLSELFSTHRESIWTDGGMIDIAGPESEMSLAFQIHKITVRDISREVLYAAVALAHVLSFQLARQTSSVSLIDSSHSANDEGTQGCVTMLLKELSNTILLVERMTQQEVAGYEMKQADEQWKKWCDICLPANSTRTSLSKRKQQRNKIGTSGVTYLIQNGTLPQPSSQPTKSQRVPPRSQSSSSAPNGSPPVRADHLLTLLGNPCHQYLSQWLHILSCLVNFSSSADYLVKDNTWINTLLSSTGLHFEFKGSGEDLTDVEWKKDVEGCILPERYRVRMLRLLLNLFSISEPNEIIVKGLFILASSKTPFVYRNLDSDDDSVSREAVSLIRHLYAPSPNSWRSCIHGVIISTLMQKEGSSQFPTLRNGILAFFSGGIGRVSPGSYVLLKPAAAVLSPDSHSSSNSKSSTGASGGASSVGATPHHVVGNGTEGIIAGLCRAEASAGIVSSIDAKNGVCEVILTTRRMVSSADSGNLSQAPLRARSADTGDRSTASARYTMTVRALHAPLSDVVSAVEVPMFLDDALPTADFLGSLLPDALTVFAEALSNFSERNNKSKKAVETDDPSIESKKRITGLCTALMALRSSTTLLSDEVLLSKFVAEEPAAKQSFASILKLASCTDVQPANLSLLPIHEARYCQLLSMLREIHFRTSAIDSTSVSHWEKQIAEFAPQRKASIVYKDGKSNYGSSESEEASRTLPAAISKAEDIGARSSVNDAAREANEATLNSRTFHREVSQTSDGSSGTEEEEDDADITAAAHPREAAIAQMSELGLPYAWCELALRRTGGANIEAAVHFCLERGGDMERLLAEERERERVIRRQSGSASSRRRGNRGDSGGSNHLLRQLLEMGFPSRWCAEALAATRNNVDEALTWILTNGERLSAEDEGMEEDDEDDIGDDDEEEDNESAEDDDDAVVTDTTETVTSDNDEIRANTILQNATPSTSEESKSLSIAVGTVSDSEPNVSKTVAWSGSITPLRFISGRSIINPETLSVSGLPTGGFSSVGTKGVLLTSGKWYYEAVLETAGCLQIGWADGSFSGHCNADRGDGCGDGPSSWAYDGWRRYRWHSSATEWGCIWKEGDVVGCLVDMDEHVISFTLNGQAEEIGMGVAFSGEGFRPCSGVYACISFNRREKLRIILGGRGSEPFKHEPLPGYRGVGDAVLDAVEERDFLVQKEDILDIHTEDSDGEMPEEKRFLCDFSDGEHGHELFAATHRYYGSDASVHLGSGRKPSSITKSSGSSTNIPLDPTAETWVSRRVEKFWLNASKDFQGRTTELAVDDSMLIAKEIKHGYEEVARQISSELAEECIALGILYARKFLLHVIITMGSSFNLQYFLPKQKGDGNCELIVARRLWSVLDACVSLRSAGWVGEAGAMAIAAEALGLGISSNDSQISSRRSLLERFSSHSAVDSENAPFLSAGGISQMLSSTLIVNLSPDHSSGFRDTSSSLAACAEAAIGGDGGGGPLIFLRKGLQSAICKSEPFRDILIAVVRRSVRLLTVADYGGNDSSSGENTEDDDDGLSDAACVTGRSSHKKESSEEETEIDASVQPDARLVCFLTGLLLSKPVQNSLSDSGPFMVSLFEAWSVGFLSASAPWRMICAFTASGILNDCPGALSKTVESLPTLAQFYSSLEGTVSRRIWAERAAVPVCSRYVQSMVELVASVKYAAKVCPPVSPFAKTTTRPWVDAATPRPLEMPCNALPLKMGEEPMPEPTCWEWDEGWVTSDRGWESWTGTIDYMSVDWKTPSRSAVRTLMDGGEGPPMLREGCYVLRGLDWDDERSGSKTGNEDGKDIYEAEKTEREKEKHIFQEQERQDNPADSSPKLEVTYSAEVNEEEQKKSGAPLVDGESRRPLSSNPVSPSPSEKDGTENQTPQDSTKKKKKKKIPNPKLPIGTVISVEPWRGTPAMARKIRWHLTGTEGVYRYGGDGGRFDISHIEINDKATRVRKRHPLPESAEQCAARHGFGSAKKYNIMLRLRRKRLSTVNDGETEMHPQGVLEWPDFAAGIIVDCVLHADGAITITEKGLLYGSHDSGWEARFGQPCFVPGSVIVLSPTRSSDNVADLNSKCAFSSSYEELLGSTSFAVEHLRNRTNGSKLRVTSEMRLLRGKQPTIGTFKPDSLSATQAPQPPPITFDGDFKASSISLSRDKRTVTCVSPDGRGSAFASVGFSKGVHYWEVKLEQADIGSVFIGVAEKPSGMHGSAALYEGQPRLNRWYGWGFVNFRATYTAGAERVYGAHCHAGDTVGVLLDCDAGRISFFFDGLKYGEHILNDLGCAFENISPFGFNADGCGSGGAGQGAPSGIEMRGGRYPAQGSVTPRALWPVIGLRNPGDRVTLSSKWMTSFGVDGPTSLKNVMVVDEILRRYEEDSIPAKTSPELPKESRRETDVIDTFFPSSFVEEAYAEYERWRSGRWFRCRTRGSGPHRLASFGLDVDLDASPLACACACAALGLRHVLLPGDRVIVKRSAGRMLELAEEAVVLGSCQGKLYYRIASQKSEGGSLTEGGGRAWFWDESEVVDSGLQVIGTGLGSGVDLPLLDRFRCTSKGGLKIMYDGGSVVRSDLEIFDGSANIGSVPFNTIIPQRDVIERRVNSCGVVRYRVKIESVGEGWISSRIRGGKEESIVMPVHSVGETGLHVDDDRQFEIPLESALVWYESYKKSSNFILSNYPGSMNPDWTIKHLHEFEELLSQGVIPELSVAESDALIASTVTAIADFSEGGDAVECPFKDMVAAVTFAVASINGGAQSKEAGVPGANQAAAAMFSGLDVVLPSSQALLARMAMLRAFNRRARLALPWLSVRPSQEGSAIFGGFCGHGASIERAGRSTYINSMESWYQPTSIASRMRSSRSLFFLSTKRLLLDNITDATTTPTPLSHDEYELPREIRTVRINRLKARRAMESNDSVAIRKHSVFSQLQNETRGWGGAALRRGFVAKGHGGQKRAFKVKLVGEGVNDYSGPYREVFTDAIQEAVKLDEKGHSAIGVLEPTPNNLSEIGENRELFMFATCDRDLTKKTEIRNPNVSPEEIIIKSSFSTLGTKRDENSREVEEALIFLGRMTGTACRHGINVDLPLPLKSVWKLLVEENSDKMNRLRELDLLAYGQQEESKDEGSTLLLWQQRMLNSFVEGMSHVMPVEIFPLFSGEELRDLFCGNPDVDVDLLKCVVEYEGYEESDDVIQFFWEVLREMSSAQRKKFLQFVWARTRLPMKASDFDSPFKIQRDVGNTGESSDIALPSASTCFFSLTLPDYSSKELLKAKLIFAIENVCTMESDYVTNDAEVGEGWRGL